MGALSVMGVYTLAQFLSSSFESLSTRISMFAKYKSNLYRLVYSIWSTNMWCPFTNSNPWPCDRGRHLTLEFTKQHVLRRNSNACSKLVEYFRHNGQQNMYVCGGTGGGGGGFEHWRRKIVFTFDVRWICYSYELQKVQG